MKSHSNERRLLWLACGVVCGLGLAYFWPHEPAFASATDRDQKFAICTVDVGPGLPDAVFVLDFSNGKLQGAMLNSQSGQFTNAWFANVAEDFKVSAKGGAKYAIIPGHGYLNVNSAGGGTTTATGLIYVAELTTGTCGCYQFQYRNQVTAGTPLRLEPVNSFPFREALR